jgi:hypothetical protein
MVAAEPPRPEEEISLDQDFLKQEESVVAPPSTRNRASERGSSSRPRASERSRSDATPSFGARSAKERRAARAAASGSPRRERQEDVLRADVVANLLQNPTRTVSEETLKAEYSYIVADLRSMGVLAAGLIVLLVVLAQVLPS